VTDVVVRPEDLLRVGHLQTADSSFIAVEVGMRTGRRSYRCGEWVSDQGK
jgi:hypothetical protein